MTETRARGQFPRRTLLGRALALLGGLVGVGVKVRCAKAGVEPGAAGTVVSSDYAAAGHLAVENNAGLVRAALNTSWPPPTPCPFGPNSRWHPTWPGWIIVDQPVVEAR